MDDEPVLTCPICSKPIRAGMGTARVDNVVAHLRCLARQNGLRALELQDRAAQILARTERAMARSQQLRAAAWSSDSRDAFALAGRISAFDAEARLVTVGTVHLIVAKDVPLARLCAGLSVIVTGHRVGDDLVATDIRINRPGFP